MITLLAVVVVVLGVFLAYVSSRPATFRIERSVLVQAPPDKPFALINDFHHWPQWSPWEKLDPAMQKTHSGEAAGKGAVYAWQGNNKVGSGRMEILDTAPGERVVIKLDFYKPFEAHNTTEFTLKPDASGTRVTWAMFGPQPFMAKLMSVFMSMDKMVGKDFESGLASMKAAAEK
jgi:uncharacterized protein YndB with AHSA1/START domain